MRKFAVIGLGQFGRSLARALASSGAEVLAIDRNAKLVEQVRDDVTLAVCLDSTDEEALKAQGIDKFDVAIVGIGDHFEAAALTAATLKILGVKKIIARAQSDLQAKILRRVGCDEVISPEGESALRWANRLTMPNLSQYLELGEGNSLVSITAPRAFHNKTLMQLNLRNQFGVNLIAVERARIVEPDESSPTPIPTKIEVPLADTKILPGDTLILVGANENIAALPRE
jgi:trk system potassium uptake protein TrkA